MRAIVHACLLSLVIVSAGTENSIAAPPLATASAPGEARRSRLADVPVLALAVRAGETLLVVDRGYAAHLMAWIRETLLDFPDP